MNRETLIAAGVDYDQGVERFADRASLYEEYLGKFFDGSTMESLRQMLLDGNRDAAFDLTHDLKGAVGNLSITKLYQDICAMVEALRVGGIDDKVWQLYDQALKQYQTVEAAVRA